MRIGIIIPLDMMQDDNVLTFCAPYIERGDFYYLTTEKMLAPAKKKKKEKLLFSSIGIDTDLSRYDVEQWCLDIAVRFYTLFCKARKDNKYLIEADAIAWANTIRLMRDNDKRTAKDIERMADFFEWMSFLPVGDKDRFWYDTVFSVDAVRKHWDKIFTSVYKMRAFKTIVVAEGY